jgi:hypothetical protein
VPRDRPQALLQPPFKETGDVVQQAFSTNQNTLSKIIRDATRNSNLARDHITGVSKKNVIDGKYSLLDLKKKKNEKKEGVMYQVWGRVDCSSGNRLGE